MRFLLPLAALVAFFFVPAVGNAEEPLHRDIDQLIVAAAGGEVNPPASDAEFVRRIYLDLIGRIPTRDETSRFVNEADPAKRAQLVDALLASPEHPAHLATVLDVMLIERLGEHEIWKTWLTAAVADNKPWDQMCREMLAPHYDADDPARGAGFFVSKRLENYGQNPVDHPALVRDVGRLLLGVDLQCAQCHDHPQIDDYKQVDYQGLYAYFAGASLRSSAEFPAVQEKPAMKIAFQSVFVSGEHEVGLRLPFGMETAIPMFEKGEEYEVAPDRKTNQPGIPKFSPLKTLASELPQPATPGFGRNMANRLWWMMLGRGQVHPLDLHHSDNPASHPEVLQLLTTAFAARQFDLRAMLREIALTDVYQRSSTLPDGASEAAIPPTSYRVALEKGLSPEQMARSLWTATGPWTDDKPFAELQKRCIKALGQPPREPETEFAPSVQGALFLSHDSALLRLLQPQPGNLIDRLIKLETPAAQADELYLAILSRSPSDDERRETMEFLQRPGGEPLARLQQLAWAMLSSTEFCLNH